MFLPLLKNFIFNTFSKWTPHKIQSLIANYDSRKENTIMSDTGGVIEWFNTKELTPTEYHNKKASSLDGTIQYWSRALPVNILTGNQNNWVPTGSVPSGWQGSSGVTWNQTGIAGSTGTYVIQLSGNDQYIYYTGLTIGKKYKLRIRCYSDNGINIGNDTGDTSYGVLESTNYWNTVVRTFTATTDKLYFTASGNIYIDIINIREDRKLDATEEWELIRHSTNRDFEAGVCDWGQNGNHSLTVSSDDKYQGTYSMLITSTGAGDADNCVILPSNNYELLEVDKKYTIELFHKASGSNISGTIKIGSKTATFNATTSAWGKAVLNFLCTDTEVGQDIRLYLNGAGSCYIDNISLTQAYDIVTIQSVKPSSLQTRSILNSNNTNYLELRSDGYVRYNVGDGTTQAINNVNVTYSANVFTTFITQFNRTDKIKIAKNGVLYAGVSCTSVGKIIYATKLNIGANQSNGELFIGLLGAIQIIRFTKIEDSNFDPTTYKIGQAITGGGAEVVGWWDWDNIVGAIAYDKSLAGNNLTAYGNAQNDVIVVKDYNSTYSLRQGTKANRPAITSKQVVFTSANSDSLIGKGTMATVKTIVIKLKRTVATTQPVLELNNTDKISLRYDGTILLNGGTWTTADYYDKDLIPQPIGMDEFGYFVLTSTNPFNANALKVSPSAYFDGSILNLAFFSSVLTSTEITKVLNYMR
jgi:hypothetical protein